MPQQLFCQKCQKMLSENSFYQYKDGTKCELCKPCLTMHIDNFDPSTFLWILEKFDVPYIEAEWNVLRDRAYTKNPAKMNGMSVLGKYLSKMKLRQWKDYSWSDTEKFKEEAEKLISEHKDEKLQEKIEQMKEAYNAGEISESQLKTYTESIMPESYASHPVQNEAVNYTEPKEVTLEEMGVELTDEDIAYLTLEWGPLYSPTEWVTLEKMKKDYMDSFDILDPGRRDTLKKICKTSLKMDQAIDGGDIETYQKLAKVFDSLMKSGKFTQAQNKDSENADAFDSVGAIVALCEKEGGIIPKWDISVPMDVVDTVINDMKNYTKSLIYEDKSLAQQIEIYLKKRENLDQMKKNKEKAEAEGLDCVEVNDEDYLEHSERVINEQEHDVQIYNDGDKE